MVADFVSAVYFLLFARELRGNRDGTAKEITGPDNSVAVGNRQVGPVEDSFKFLVRAGCNQEFRINCNNVVLVAVLQEINNFFSQLFAGKGMDGDAHYSDYFCIG